MAGSRGRVALWAACVRIRGGRQPIAKHIGSLAQPADLRWICPARPPGGVTTTPTGLRRRTAKPALPAQSFHHAGRPRPAACHEEDWDDSPNPCAPVRPKESSGAHATAATPLSAQTKVAELLVPGKRKCSELPFLLTTVDGSREDDIDVGRSADRPQKRQRHGCFRSLFEAESCPAPFAYGSGFYCFRSPGTEAMARGGLNSRREVGPQRNKAEALASPRAASLCSRARTESSRREGDGEGEQKLAVAYERLRHELPNFFRKNHDYTMYSSDIEFINGLLNTKTRGRAAYQLSLSLWRLVCLFYFADAQLEVLKLTKHMEDGSIKARWRLRGLPFLTLMLRFYRKDKSPLYRCYDAFSTFYVGHDGLIHCHKVEKVMPAQPPALPGVTSILAGALVALGVQENRPALNLLPLLLSSPRQGRE